MPFISITRLRVRSWWFFPGFIWDAVRSARQARATDGNLGVKLLRDAHNTWWTCTAWDAESSMRRFMLARPHGPAMRKLLHWCDEASLVHWNQPDASLPTWAEAHRRLQSEGRVSKVNHPSPAQTAFTIAAPVLRAGSDVPFK